MNELEDRVLLLLVAAISLLFAWVVWPFSGAILWAVVLATLFAPLQQRLLAWQPRWPNGMALMSVTIIVVVVILPLAFVVSLLLQEAAEVYAAFQAGEIDIGDKVRQLRDALPGWATGLLDRMRAPDLETLRERFSAVIMASGRFLAGQALTFGQGTLDFFIAFFVMLYLLYFLLRDGRTLMRRIGRAVPLHAEQKAALVQQFAVTIRATVKGSLAVAVVQGALGGLIFWFLGIRAPVIWAAVMAVLSLLPVVGTGLVWVPVAIYLMASGEIWQGLLLIAYGVLVIGMVDNVLRPILVGRDTKIPDYVVLIATLGGLSVFGVNGIVIGPVVAAMFLATWHVFTDRRQEPSNTGSA